MIYLRILTASALFAAALLLAAIAVAESVPVALLFAALCAALGVVVLAARRARAGG